MLIAFFDAGTSLQDHETRLGECDTTLSITTVQLQLLTTDACNLVTLPDNRIPTPTKLLSKNCLEKMTTKCFSDFSAALAAGSTSGVSENCYFLFEITKTADFSGIVEKLLAVYYTNVLEETFASGYSSSLYDDINTVNAFSGYKIF